MTENTGTENYEMPAGLTEGLDYDLPRPPAEGADRETRVSTHWGVAHNYPERHRSVMQYDDEESAREMAPLYGPDACVVRCTVTTTPWERVDPAPGCNPIPCPNCSATLYTHHHTECPRWGTEPPWEPLSRDWQLGRDDSVSLAKADPPAAEPAGTEAHAETLRGLQAEVRELALAHGFNTTDVPLNFCLTHGEVAELAEALHASVDRGFRAWRKDDDVPSEVADVTVFLFRIADMLGFDLQDAVNAKLRVVAARTYRPGPNGVLVKDAGPGA